MSPKMNAKTSAYTYFFSPKIGGDTEGVENLTFSTPPTSCRAPIIPIQAKFYQFVL